MTAVVSASHVARDHNHRYWFDDNREAFGVTAVLKANGFIDDRYFTEQATLRGTFVHQARQYLDEGTLDESTIDPQIAGYVTAYRKWLDECQVGPVVLNETVLGDPTLRLAGTIDFARYIGPHLSVVDVKSGLPQVWHRLQLAAYAELAKRALHHAVIRRFGLYLRKDGTYSFLLYPDRHDWDTFKAALTVAQFKRAYGCR